MNVQMMEMNDLLYRLNSCLGRLVHQIRKNMLVTDVWIDGDHAAKTADRYTALQIYLLLSGEVTVDTCAEIFVETPFVIFTREPNNTGSLRIVDLYDAERWVNCAYFGNQSFLPRRLASVIRGDRVDMRITHYLRRKGFKTVKTPLASWEAEHTLGEFLDHLRLRPFLYLQEVRNERLEDGIRAVVEEGFKFGIKTEQDMIADPRELFALVS